MSVGVFQSIAAAAVLCCASQIELISGIYRAADFPFVLSYTADRIETSDGISLSLSRVYTARIRSRVRDSPGWPRIINFQRIINQRGRARRSARTAARNRGLYKGGGSRGRKFVDSSMRFEQIERR